jgi:hypothetical protein
MTPENRRELKKDLNAIIKLSLKLILLFITGTHIKATSRANNATDVLMPISMPSLGAGMIIR